MSQRLRRWAIKQLQEHGEALLRSTDWQDACQCEDCKGARGVLDSIDREETLTNERKENRTV